MGDERLENHALWSVHEPSPSDFDQSLIFLSASENGWCPGCCLSPENKQHNADEVSEINWKIKLNVKYT